MERGWGRGYVFRKQTTKSDSRSCCKGPGKISWHGIKEIADQPHNDKEKQLQLLNVLPQLLKNAVQVKSGDMFKYAKIKGLEGFYLNIKLDVQQKEWILYSITDKIKKNE